jgi:hypothetical protein
MLQPLGSFQISKFGKSTKVIKERKKERKLKAIKILKKPFHVDFQRAFSTIIKYNEILSFSVKIDVRRYAILDIYCRFTQICYFLMTLL